MVCTVPAGGGLQSHPQSSVSSNSPLIPTDNRFAFIPGLAVMFLSIPDAEVLKFGDWNSRSSRANRATQHLGELRRLHRGLIPRLRSNRSQKPRGAWKL